MACEIYKRPQRERLPGYRTLTSNDQQKRSYKYLNRFGFDLIKCIFSRACHKFRSQKMVFLDFVNYAH